MKRARALRAALTVTAVCFCAAAGSASAATFNANAASLGAIPDPPAAAPVCGDFSGTARNVTFSVSGVTSPITDARVSITVNHTWVGDLRVELISPSSVVTHTIFSQTGNTTGPNSCASDSSNVAGPYIFADNAPAAPTWWVAAGPPLGDAGVIPSGSYRASTAGGAPGTGVNTLISPAFAGLTAAQVNGTWTLRIRDSADMDSGSVTAANLGLNGIAAPQVFSDPGSPADNNAPIVKGVAPGDSTVNLYMTADCTGAPFATLTDAPFATTGTPIAVADNSSVTVSAQATDTLGFVSACSAPYTYVEDSVPPGTLSGTDPGSPGLSVQPRVKGSSEAGTVVKIYPSGDCTGAPLAAGSDSELAGAGVEITVGPGSTTQLSARATDPAGLDSGCSGAISYTQGTAQDKTPPDTSFKKKPKKKSDDDTPTFKALSNEPGSTFQCKVDKKPFEACKAKTTFDLKPGKHTVKVAAVDPAGNVDPTPAKFKFTIKP